MMADFQAQRVAARGIWFAGLGFFLWAGLDFLSFVRAWIWGG